MSVFVNRVWKVAAIGFALTTLVLWVYPRGVPAPHAPSSRAIDRGLLARLRVPASQADIAEQELLEEAVSSEDTAQTVRVLAKLGIVGSARAVAVLARFEDDARPGVAEAALAAMGSIGGDAATRLLLSGCDDGQIRTRQAAVAALAVLGSEAAIARLTALARDRGDPLWRSAMAARWGAPGRRLRSRCSASWPAGAIRCGRPVGSSPPARE